MDGELDVDLHLTGKRALVTGASAGTGATIARSLAAEGADVVVHGRDGRRARDVADGIVAAGGRAAVVLGDLSTRAGAERVAREAVDAFGSVDVLVNNAGLIGSYEQWDDTTDEDWAAMYDGVVLVVVRLVQALRGHMTGNGWGRIITLSSAQSGQPFAMMPHYSTAKGALHTMNKSLSKQLDRTGVTANVISPGIIVTDRIRRRMTEAAAREGRSTDWPDIETHVLTTELDNPSGRLARPEDVAYAVTVLASPRADHINGANLRVDGGSTVATNP